MVFKAYYNLCNVVQKEECYVENLVVSITGTESLEAYQSFADLKTFAKL